MHREAVIDHLHAVKDHLSAAIKCTTDALKCTTDAIKKTATTTATTLKSAFVSVVGPRHPISSAMVTLAKSVQVSFIALWRAGISATTTAVKILCRTIDLLLLTTERAIIEAAKGLENAATACSRCIIQARNYIAACWHEYFSDVDMPSFYKGFLPAIAIGLVLSPIMFGTMLWGYNTFLTEPKIPVIKASTEKYKFPASEIGVRDDIMESSDLCTDIQKIIKESKKK